MKSGNVASSPLQRQTQCITIQEASLSSKSTLSSGAIPAPEFWPNRRTTTNTPTATSTDRAFLGTPLQETCPKFANRFFITSGLVEKF